MHASYLPLISPQDIQQSLRDIDVSSAGQWACQTSGRMLDMYVASVSSTLSLRTFVGIYFILAWAHRYRSSPPCKWTTSNPFMPVLPLTVPSISTQPILAGQPHRSQPIDVLQVSSSAAEPSIGLHPCPLSGSSCEQNEVADVDNGLHTKGVVMGCNDRSLYVFHATPSPATPVSSLDHDSEPNDDSPTSSPMSPPHSPLLPR